MKGNTFACWLCLWVAYIVFRDARKMAANTKSNSLAIICLALYFFGYGLWVVVFVDLANAVNQATLADIARRLLILEG